MLGLTYANCRIQERSKAGPVLLFPRYIYLDIMVYPRIVANGILVQPFCHYAAQLLLTDSLCP